MKTTVSLFLFACVLSAVIPSFALTPTNTGQGAPKPSFKVDKREAGKFVTTTDKIAVLDAPKAGSKVLQEYDKGAMMAVIGQATGTDYLFVSPCNACDHGYVLKSEFFAKSKQW